MRHYDNLTVGDILKCILQEFHYQRLPHQALYIGEIMFAVREALVVIVPKHSNTPDIAMDL